MTANRLLTAGDAALAPADDLAVVEELLRLVGAGSIAAAARDADGAAEVTGTGDPQALLATGMAGFARAHPDALERANAMGHFTGSAFVVDATGQRGLLLFHRKLQRWLQPGGHADGDANLVAVALREASEETGIPGLRIDPLPVDVDVHVIPQPHPGGRGSHLHLDVRFLVVAPPGATEVGNHESEALRWVTLDELPHLDVDAGTIRLARAAFARFGVS